MTGPADGPTMPSMETSNLPPPQPLSAPQPPTASRLPDPRVPVLAESPVAGVSAAQWNAARQQAVAFHAAQQQAAEFHAARRLMAQQWNVPSLSAPRGPSRSHRRRAGVIAGLVIAGMIAAATTMVVMGGEEAEAYSLDAATMEAQQTDTITLEYETSMPGGTTVHADVEMDLGRGLTSMTMDDGFSGEWDYIFDVDSNRLYVDADSMEDMGLDVGNADWVGYELDELTDGDMTMTYSQFGENPLDASQMFDGADEVEDLGFDMVRGERVRHYEVTIDEELAFGMELSTSGFVNDGDGDPEGKVVFDVYVNRSNQMVRLAYSMQMMGEYISFDVTITGINEPVDIEVPDRSDVVDMDDLEY